jgi:hypothetical protein
VIVLFYLARLARSGQPLRARRRATINIAVQLFVVGLVILFLPLALVNNPRGQISPWIIGVLLACAYGSVTVMLVMTIAFYCRQRWSRERSLTRQMRGPVFSIFLSPELVRLLEDDPERPIGPFADSVSLTRSDHAVQLWSGGSAPYISLEFDLSEVEIEWSQSGEGLDRPELVFAGTKVPLVATGRWMGISTRKGRDLYDQLLRP